VIHTLWTPRRTLVSALAVVGYSPYVVRSVGHGGSSSEDGWETLLQLVPDPSIVKTLRTEW